VKIITCPNCKGKGVVPVVFPPDTPEWVKEAKFERMPCPDCNGSGFIMKGK